MEYASASSPGVVNTRLHFLDSPFRIVATRVLRPMPTDSAVISELSLPTVSAEEQIIWQTSQQTFAYQGNPSIGIINNVVMTINKPTQAEYVGFGEQGGRTVLKRPTYMNYFCRNKFLGFYFLFLIRGIGYDNYNYTKVYGQGALDPKEPL